MVGMPAPSYRESTGADESPALHPLGTFTHVLTRSRKW